MYTAEEREYILGIIVENAKLDERLDGCILVGSGAIGFSDRFSDIDICMVTNDNANVSEIFDDWRERIESLLPVFSHIPSIRGKDILLHNFFLNNYLEINICFLRNADMEARKDKWKVLFDHTNTLEQKMIESWERNEKKNGAKNYYQDRIRAIWHYIMHAFVAYKRKRYWQAFADIEEIRNQTIKLHGLRKGLETKRNREVDLMDKDFLSMLEETLVHRIEKTAIETAIKKVTDCFFNEAFVAEKEFNLDIAQLMKEKMSELLSML